MPFSTRTLAAVAATLTVLLGGGTILITADDGQAPPHTLTVNVDGLDAGKAPDATLTVPQAAVAAVAPGLERQLQDEAPPIAPEPDLDRAAAAAEKIARAQRPLPTAGATAGFAGCRTSFVANQSSRRGVRPQVQTLHYTVSGNRVGWGDVDAVVALFNRPSSQASSNFVIDTEAHCAYIVPIEAKAWTQAAGNPFSVSYEIIATGKEARYLEPTGMAKLRSVIREVSHRTGIPMRRGSVRNCTPTRTGIVEHRDWGLCGGGHVDITPFRIDKVVAELVAGGVTALDRATCRKLNAWRRAGRPQGGAWQRRSIARRDALHKRGVTCLASGPTR